MNSPSEGSGLPSLYVLMYQIFTSPTSWVPARWVCFSLGTSESSIYSSILNAHTVTAAIDISFPSNSPGLAILIVSGIFGIGGVGGVCVSVWDIGDDWVSIGDI